MIFRASRLQKALKVTACAVLGLALSVPFVGQAARWSKKVWAKKPVAAKVAVESIGNEIRTATSSMTSVPKPLKFLREHFEPLKVHFEGLRGNTTAAGVARPRLAWGRCWL